MYTAPLTWKLEDILITCYRTGWTFKSSFFLSFSYVLLWLIDCWFCSHSSSLMKVFVQQKQRNTNICSYIANSTHYSTSSWRCYNQLDNLAIILKMVCLIPEIISSFSPFESSASGLLLLSKTIFTLYFSDLGLSN